MKNPVRSTLISALSVAAFLLLGLYFQAAPPLQAPLRTVTVGVYQNAPKIYTTTSGDPTGPFVELLEAIARNERWSLTFVECSWAECLQMLSDGRLDLMPDVAYSTERSERFDFHKVPAVNSWSQFYRNTSFEAHTLESLDGRRVAVLRDAVQESYLEQLMAGSNLNLTLVQVESYEEGFEAVRDGLADAIVANTFFGSRYAAGYGLIETPLMFNPTGLYFATKKGTNQDLLTSIDAYLTLWRQNPDSLYFQAMREAMLPAPVTVVPRWLKTTLLTTVGVALLFVVFSILLRRQVRRATDDLRKTNQHLDRVLSASPVVLYLLRQENERVVPEWVSPNIERLFGFPPEQTLERGWFERQLHPEDRETVLANLERLPAQKQLTQEYRILDATGRTRYIHDELHLTDDRPGEIIGTWTDLTQAVKQAAELRFLTEYEPLTGLPNRARLHERLTRMLFRSGKDDGALAVLSIDLDRFRHINDTLGHVRGDALLRVAAKKIEALTGPEDILARVGGNSFVLVLGSKVSAGEATEIARRILQIFTEPISSNPPLIVTASIGISRFPDHGADADTLLKHAEIALYEAKNKGRNTFREFVAELSAAVQGRMATETALRGTVERKELVLHYQPQFDLNTGEMIGVEALVRWNHPERGLLLPREFISIAEETGLIHEIGVWILRDACRQMKAWHDAQLPFGRIAVNLSVLQIEKQSLTALVAQVLKESGLSPGLLELEITESTIMREPDIALVALRDLKKLGLSLAVDDFGTGHSSLAYLKRLPFDRVKIDQAFVRDIGRSTNDEAICRAVIDLGRTLGLETIAEGVEREEQAAFLKAEGCAFVQGYLYGRPLPAEAFRQAWQKLLAGPKGAQVLLSQPNVK
jgi:diguanylate cyclase (GGDEF)-like protein